MRPRVPKPDHQVEPLEQRLEDLPADEGEAARQREVRMPEVGRKLCGTYRVGAENLWLNSHKIFRDSFGGIL